jgi:small-conductance mechanosensitive channel
MIVLSTTLLTTLVYFVVILLVTAFVAWLIGVGIGQALRGSSPLVAVQARRAGSLVVWLVGIILAVEQLGINSDVLLLAVALFGIAALVAVRTPLENFASRYFTNIYLPFRLGDSIGVQGLSGRVIEVNAMSTILLTEKDTLVSIPNSVLLSEAVTNSTPQAWKEIVVPIVLGGDLDIATFESTVLKSLNKLKLRLDERFPPTLTLKARGPQTTELALTVMIRRPGDRDAMTTEVNKRVREIVETFRARRGVGGVPAAAG